MFTEIAKPVTLVSCILSLFAVFYSAFLDFSLDFPGKIYSSLSWLVVAAAISLLSGWIFQEAAGRGSAHTSLASTLPLKMFFWASSGMLLLFLISWYLQANCIFYRDVRRL
jgi:hypothetical protein